LTFYQASLALGSRHAIILGNPDNISDSNPSFSGGVRYECIRCQTRTFPSHCCLVTASEFHIRNGEKKSQAAGGWQLLLSRRYRGTGDG
jgi:hypothetical protein